MISEKEKAIIVECARKYNLSAVILFGSSLEKKDANDIDIGIKGIPSGRFFEFYGELLLSLAKRIDVVDLSKENSFNRLVEREGVKLYG